MSQTYPDYLGLRFEEEVALKTLLTGITVPDASGRAIPVKVWYRLPDRELRTITYPYLMIDFLGMRRDPSREHRGYMKWATNAYDDNATAEPSWSNWPIPMVLTFQVATASRSNQHDVIINDILSTSMLPWRFGQLNCPSGVNRRLDVLSMSPADSLDENGKRLFRKMWTIEVDAEIVGTQIPIVPPTELAISVENLDNATTDAAFDVTAS